MNSRGLVELEALEGWLIKKKRDKNKFFGGDTKRWFKIQKIKGSPVDDLCMCYFKSPNDPEPSGWIYLKDIRELSDDGRIMTVVTTARKIVLEAQTKAEHKLWLQGLVDYSPFITSLEGVQTDIKVRRQNTSPSPTEAFPIPNKGRSQPVVCNSHDSERGFFPQGGDGNGDCKPGSFVPRERTFSRHVVDGDDDCMARSDFENEEVGSQRDSYEGVDNRAYRGGSDREDSGGDNRRKNKEPARRREPSRDAPRGGGSGTFGGNSGSFTSRMHAHIAGNAPRDGSSNSLSGMDENSGPRSDRDRDSSVRSSVEAKGDPDVETDYTALAADKKESLRNRLQEMEDEGLSVDPDSKDADNRPPPLNVSSSPPRGSGNPTPKGSVSHFQTSSGIQLPSRDAKQSIDDIITRSSRSSSACNSARRPPPMSSYSPHASTDYRDNDDEDDGLGIDLNAEKMRYSQNADSKGSDERSRPSSTTFDEKGNAVSKPPLGRGVSGGSSGNLVGEGRRPPPPSGAPPPSKYNAHLNGSIPVDNNFVSDNWDDDSDDDMPSDHRGYANFRSDSNPNSRPGSSVLAVHAPRSNASSRGSYDAGVRQDDNWLDDNFDS